MPAKQQQPQKPHNGVTGLGVLLIVGGIVGGAWYMSSHRADSTPIIAAPSCQPGMTGYITTKAADGSPIRIYCGTPGPAPRPPVPSVQQVENQVAHTSVPSGYQYPTTTTKPAKTTSTTVLAPTPTMSPAQAQQVEQRLGSAPNVATPNPGKP